MSLATHIRFALPVGTKKRMLTDLFSAALQKNRKFGR